MLTPPCFGTAVKIEPLAGIFSTSLKSTGGEQGCANRIDGTDTQPVEAIRPASPLLLPPPPLFVSGSPIRIIICSSTSLTCLLYGIGSRAVDDRRFFLLLCQFRVQGLQLGSKQLVLSLKQNECQVRPWECGGGHGRERRGKGAGEAPVWLNKQGYRVFSTNTVSCAPQRKQIMDLVLEVEFHADSIVLVFVRRLHLYSSLSLSRSHLARYSCSQSQRLTWYAAAEPWTSTPLHLCLLCRPLVHCIKYPRNTRR